MNRADKTTALDNKESLQEEGSVCNLSGVSHAWLAPEVEQDACEVHACDRSVVSQQSGGSATT